MKILKIMEWRVKNIQYAFLLGTIYFFILHLVFFDYVLVVFTPV